jgi:WD40 repeat protein
LEAFKERVRAFLEDADASEETINRWHEIESFLQGITDTQTLTGLLADLKQEILASILEPQTGNYLKLVPDLDAYTDAPDGEIVKYTGPTTDQYTHGWDYERKAGTSTVTTFNVGTDPYTDSSKYLGIPEHAAAYLQYFPKNNQICTKTDRVLQVYKTVEDSDYFVFKDSHQVGDWFIFSTYAYPIDTMTEDEDTITAKGSDTRSVVFSKANVVSLPIWQTPNGKYIATITIGGYGYWIGLNDDGTPYCYGSCYNRGPETTETIDAPASWQPSKSMSVID